MNPSRANLARARHLAVCALPFADASAPAPGGVVKADVARPAVPHWTAIGEHNEAGKALRPSPLPASAPR
eukprot:CAMPEP_0176193096 /NCGR_PEP_ID=MMETSP0121_2-20121125/5310_1 /TAXON_ID=160619 /ORGANISM="Kryptoperidinium foliaceum, Strain CCMP 1326" /LENGTH=69 /DNA_ID=CAMNT_0017531803 /DNA_START=10 /DNA_END=220 /DNA_ORIENTATION=-